MTEFRIRYAKEGCLRFISHLDLIRGFERALRRGGLPVAFSEGYHPHPLMSFGPALSVGVESCAEYIDITMKESMDPQTLQERFNAALPEGLRIIEARVISRKVKPLTAVINRATYLITPYAATNQQVTPCIEELWNSERLPVLRRAKDGGEKTVDIRPLWYKWQVIEDDEGLKVEIEVEVGSHGAIRPDEFLRLAKDGIPQGRVLRSGLWIVNGSSRLTPMDLC